MSDIYYTVASDGESKVTEKMSRFLGFAHHVCDETEAREYIKLYQNEYHDSRHVCWAYALGPKGDVWQLNDNGEPSGTAGKPILGQIRSLGLTDVVVVVVRYFGGIKLGTPGLIAAYRETARQALDDAGTREMYETERIEVMFPYMCADGVMKIVKGEGLEVVEREFDNVCRLLLEVRASRAEELRRRLAGVEGAEARRTGQKGMQDVAGGA